MAHPDAHDCALNADRLLCKTSGDKLGSLCEMYEVDAELLVRLGEAFVHIDGMFAGGILTMNRPVGEGEMFWLRTNLPVLADHCSTLQLPVTYNLIMAFYRDYEFQNPTWNDSFMRLSCMKQSFKAELSTRLCLFVHADRAVHYVSRVSPGPEPLFGKSVADTFPSTQADANDAGRCFAFEQNTASVFHSMRVLEKGLHAFAETLGITPKIPVVLQDWYNIIDQIETAIRKQQSLPKSIYKNETLQFYSEAATQFRYFKDAWRNHAMHSRVKYEEADALRVLVHVKDFMQTLAANGLREICLMI
jgi:hypothetical protein